jgi:hypothetical protein
MNIYTHTREYKVPVLNRGQLLQFNYLCTRNVDIQPFVFVSTQLKGARLQQQVRLNFVWGIPVQTAAIRGLAICAYVVIMCGFRLLNVWLASGFSICVGLFAQFLGAAEYKFERWIWRLLAG